MRIKITVILILMAFLTGCVQKTYKRTVIFLLDTKDIKGIRSVGIRGIDKPLSWEYDMQMVPLKNGNTYKTTVEFFTGYKFTEVKFVINDQFELKEGANRRIDFSDKDTTIYQATYNIAK